MTLRKIQLYVEEEFNDDPPPSGDPNSRHVSLTVYCEVTFLVLGSPETPPRVMHYAVTSGLVPRQKFLDDAEGYFSSQILFFNFGLAPNTLAEYAQFSREAVAEHSRRVVPFEVFMWGEKLLPSLDAIEQYMRDFQPALYVPAVDGTKGVPVESLEYITPAGTTEEECSICLQEFAKAIPNGGGRGRWTIRMPCLHVYHKHCIIQWLKTNNKCPLCRYEMRLGY